MLAERLLRARAALGAMPATDATHAIAHACALLERLPDADFVDVELRRLETLVRVLRARGELSALFLDVLADIQRVVEGAHAAYARRELAALFERNVS